MMIRTFSGLICATTLAALPLVSHADAKEKALDTCTQAFIQHLSSTHGDANYRVAKPTARAFMSGSSTVYQNRRIGLSLTATSVPSGDVIARADCTTTASGELIAMTSRPASTSQPKSLRVSARNER